MKSVSCAIFSLLAMSQAHAISGRCTSGFPTTTFEVSERGADVVVKLTHHNGTAFMPIHSGIVVPNDFALLEEKARLLTLTGSVVEFAFPKEKCKTYGPGLYHCHSGETKTFGGIEMRAQHWITRRATEQVMDMRFEKIRMALELLINSRVHPIEMEYIPEDCTGFRD